MRIAPIAVDIASEQELDAWHELHQAAHRADFPGEPTLARAATVGELLPSDDRRLAWAAWSGDDLVGGVILYLPGHENSHLAEVNLCVHPDVRRRGIGRALFDCASAAAVDNGRSVLTGSSPAQGPGAGFARAVGMTAGLEQVRSVLDTADVDHAALARYAAGSESRTNGYELVRWVDHCPEEILGSVAAVTSAINDAPTGDMDWRPDSFDAARIRMHESASVRRGWRRHVVGVREQATNTIAGMTVVLVSPDTPCATQGLTSVLARFRGGGFGLWLKAAMLMWLAETQPHVTRYETYNAAENRHMLAINRRLGYRPVDTWKYWQRRLR